MSGEPQLERSVLEGKERDKLQAIADALGLKTTPRAKKSDLIDGILRATGVEAGPPAEAEAAKPRRTTRKRVTGAAAERGDAAGQGVLATLPPGGPEPVGETAPDPVAEAPRDPSTRDPLTVDPSTDAEEAEPAEVATARPEAEQEPRAEPDGAAATARPDGPAPAASRNGGERPAATEPRPQPARPSPSAVPGPPGPGNHLNPPPATQGQPGGSQQHQPSPPQPGQQNHGAPAEGGDVRRNRRRRGRDRDRLAAGYDTQAQQADQAYAGDPIPCDGLLELRPDGYGFLRTSGYLQGNGDVYVSTSQVRRFALRAGDRIVGASRPATTQERFGALLRIDSVGGQNPDEARRRPRFEDLTPVPPNERLTLETGEPGDAANTTGRIIDLLTPIGKGQRGLIASPPKAGKTTVLQHIVNAIAANHPDVHVLVLLVDERPEEVTEMRRSVPGEVVGSAFDRPAEEHTSVADLVIEVAKRRVEQGQDVVVVLDGISRLSRAYNVAAPASGRVLDGGIDAGALFAAKRLLGAARKLEEGGSLTILATVLAHSGSAMETVIYEELRDAANMELRLDPHLAARRIYPAVDVGASSTRHEELLLSEDELRAAWRLRRTLAAGAEDGSGRTTSDALLGKLTTTRTNAALVAEVAGTPGDPLPLEGSL